MKLSAAVTALVIVSSSAFSPAGQAARVSCLIEIVSTISQAKPSVLQGSSGL